MKNILFNKSILKAMMMLFAASSLFLSCSDDDGGGPPELDHASIIPKDSALQSADRGEMIVIFGRNLATTKEVYFNGALAALNTTLVTNGNILVSIPSNAPYIDAENKITVVTEYGVDELDFILTQPPIITSFTGVAENGATISIKGEFFTGTEAVGFINVDSPEDTLWADIVDETDEEVRVVVPDGTKISNIYLKTGSGSTVTGSTFGLNYIIYAEKLADGWENWSWSSDIDFQSPTKPKSGDVSWKQVYTGGWGGIQLFGNDLPLMADGTPLYTHLKMSIYGGPGTSGKEIVVTINWGAQIRITLEEGKWTDYTISLADQLGAPDKINVLVLQDVGNVGVTAPYLLYIDDVGLL